MSSVCLIILTVASASLIPPSWANENLGLRSEDSLQFQSQDYDGNYEDEDGDPRFLFSSTSLVPVNSTLIRIIGALVGALLIGIPLFLAYSTFLNSGSSGGGGGGYGSHYRRFKREDQDELAMLIHALMSAFKKYDVDEVGCQILLACESGKYQKGQTHPLYREMPSKVNKLLSALRLYDLNPSEFLLHGYLEELEKAHERGRETETKCSTLFQEICPKSHHLGQATV